jgi:mannitol operon repressor
MSKRKLPDIKELVSLSEEFLREFQNETDRGTALVACAYLDDILCSMLTKFLVDDKKLVDAMLGHRGPLGTFSSRIDATYLLGLIRRDQFGDLNTIRKIRNEFAHSHGPRSFDFAPISEFCRSFQQIAAAERFRADMSSLQQQILIDRFKSNREKFIGNVVHLMTGLMLRASAAKHQETGRAVFADNAEALPFEKPER